tara:strand:+ start:309 stop:884 length:576 start_codon:yes stop_codon:yes gene_type:complete
MASKHSIVDFKSRLKGGGARPNLFQVEMTSIEDAETKVDFKYLCKAAQIPASTVASIDVPFRGRILKVAGDRTFETWTITVINDEDYKIRKYFEGWMQRIAQYADASGLSKPGSYMESAKVKQLGRKETTESAAEGSGLEVLATYTFHDIFPISLGAIQLNYESTNVIEEFQVELQVNYWTPDDVSKAEAN